MTKGKLLEKLISEYAVISNGEEFDKGDKLLHINAVKYIAKAYAIAMCNKQKREHMKIIMEGFAPILYRTNFHNGIRDAKLPKELEEKWIKLSDST